jgi:Ca2+/H+ antiporter, TMEM165/GDT1 family
VVLAAETISALSRLSDFAERSPDWRGDVLSSLGHTVSVRDAAVAFGTVFPAELADKSLIATVVLTTRFGRPLLTWLGVCAAFVMHVVIAVTAGQLLAQLDQRFVGAVVTVLFTVGAIVLWRSANTVDVDEHNEPEVATSWKVFATSFAVLGLAEFGDLTQLATAGLVARTGSPVSVGLGAFGALSAIAAGAATGGRALSRVIPIRLLRRGAAVMFAVLAAWTFTELVS